MMIMSGQDWNDWKQPNTIFPSNLLKYWDFETKFEPCLLGVVFSWMVIFSCDNIIKISHNEEFDKKYKILIDVH